jgi:hypothetical protein
MGLLTTLLTLPVTGPVKAGLWAVMQVAAEAERRYYDEGAIRRDLEELQRMADEGELSEEEYIRMEDALVERLIEARARAGR